MDAWVDTPPAPCHITGRDQPHAGQPYLVEGFYYAQVTKGQHNEARVLPRVIPLVHAASQIRRVCELPGSPFVLLTKDDAAIQEAIRDERDDLRTRVVELESEIETMRAGAAFIDVEALTNTVVRSLEDRLPKRPGPKPKTAA